MLGVPDVLEWDFSAEELVGEYAQSPNIDLNIVQLLGEHLRREIVIGTTERASHFVAAVTSTPEVGNFNPSSLVNEDIFRFEVPVSIPVAVHIHNSLYNLPDNRSDLPFRGLHVFEKLLSVEVLHKNEVVELVFELGVAAYDVRVVKACLDPVLLFYLCFHAILTDHRLQHRLHSVDGAGLLMHA